MLVLMSLLAICERTRSMADLASSELLSSFMLCDCGRDLPEGCQVSAIATSVCTNVLFL